jgi:hypothetical protein
MKIKILIILTLVTLISCKEENDSPSVSDAQLNQIGNKLAEWGNSNCKIIAINETDILWQGLNAGGCSEVYFEFMTIDRESFFDLVALENFMKEAGIEDWLIDREINMRQAFLDHENEVKQNLKTAVDGSTCQLSEFISNINSIEPNSESNLIEQYLECLGTIEIIDGTFGSE